MFCVKKQEVYPIYLAKGYYDGTGVTPEQSSYKSVPLNHWFFHEGNMGMALCRTRISTEQVILGSTDPEWCFKPFRCTAVQVTVLAYRKWTVLTN